VVDVATVQRVVDFWCSGRMLVKAAGMNLRSVQRIVEAHQFLPRRIRSSTRPPMPSSSRLTKRAKSRFDRTQPGLSMKSGRAGTMTVAQNNARPNHSSGPLIHVTSRRSQTREISVSRVQLHALTYILGKFPTKFATPELIKDCSLSSLNEKHCRAAAKAAARTGLSCVQQDLTGQLRSDAEEKTDGSDPLRPLGGPNGFTDRVEPYGKPGKSLRSASNSIHPGNPGWRLLARIPRRLVRA
jgi:hypothetical protein